MSEESKREKDLTFQRIRNEANSSMTDILDTCGHLYQIMGLGKIHLPNLIVTYNNKIIALEKEFTNAGIDFYDRFQCESRFVIEQRLQLLILEGNTAIDKYFCVCQISKEQAAEFVDSYKKPSFLQKFFLGAKYEPKRSIFIPEQKKRAQQFLSNYITCDSKIADFSIEKDMAEAVWFYRILCTINGITNFDDRIEKINSELQKLGYSSII